MEIVALLAWAGSPALAADMAVKAPPASPATVVHNSWSGLYVDGAAGYQWTDYNWTFNSPYLNTLAPPGAGLSAPFSMSSGSGALGFHIGYQQQFNWLVVGAEFGGSTPIKSRAAVSAAAQANNPTNNYLPCGFTNETAGVTSSTCQASIGSVMTFGGKLGVASGDWLLYAVGGSAFNAGLSGSIVGNNGAIQVSNVGARANGYYVGGGLDYMLAKTNLVDFIVGLEYEHIGLQSANLCGGGTIAGVGAPAPCGTSGSVLQSAVSAQQDIVWGKLTMKFNPFGS